MTLHLMKLAVGPQSLAELTAWQQHYLRLQEAHGAPPELMHVTRQTPKRAQELLAGGSIYWVIKGIICARQPLLALRPITENGIPHCGLILGPQLIRTIPRSQRPFQGWRYLTTTAAPADLDPAAPPSDPENPLLHQLAASGLI